MKIPKKVRTKYESLLPPLNRAKEDIERLIRHSLRDLGDPHLIRHRLVEARVKELGELWAKARSKGWKSDEVLNKAKDLIGVRIVCANLEDIPRARDLVLQNPRFTLINGSDEDFIRSPKDDGYRGFHFNVDYESIYENKAISIQCEVQIRSMLQDSWATMAHRDIYKEGEDLPEDLTKLTRRLSDLLAVADGIAQDIREQVSKPRKVTKRPAGVAISENGLAFVYFRAFKELPPDYLIKFVMKKCVELNVNRLDSFERELLKKGNRKILEQAYEEKVTWEMNEDQFFEAIPYIVAKGIDFAKKVVRKEAKREWDEIEAFYRSELISQLPETFEEFLSNLNDSGWIEMIGDVFDSIDYCIICATKTVNPYMFTNGALEHYEIKENWDETYSELYGAVCNSGADASEGSLCNYCEHVASKD
ncbi:hypothetical protein MYX64_03145 [Nitrospinae bacterium AH_259_B05_G02_I21]|nr:hypothetical protein [Nitrospinae bacterium AH_259_B05_G02_I21]MDA2931972.1 hypothetical protein [Nitrospinae bacterium AH-259-F20]